MFPYTKHGKRLSLLIFIIMTFTMLTSCNEVMKILQQMDVKEPSATIKKVNIAGLSLKQVDLVFDIAIENPNSMGINLQGLDYDLLFNGASFIKGQNQNKLQIAANSSGNVQIPLALTFSEITKAVQSFADLDTIPYQLDLKVGVDVPVLGIVQIPVSKKGSFPNIKIPKISLSGIKLNKIGFTGADLNLKIKIDNPNALGFVTSNFNYDLQVNGKKWISGLLDHPVKISKKAKQTVSIPISLDFLEMGSAVYQLLTGDNMLDYQLSGKADFKSDFALLNSFTLPINKTGKIDLTK